MNGKRLQFSLCAVCGQSYASFLFSVFVGCGAGLSRLVPVGSAPDAAAPVLDGFSADVCPDSGLRATWDAFFEALASVGL